MHPVVSAKSHPVRHSTSRGWSRPKIFCLLHVAASVREKQFYTFTHEPRGNCLFIYPFFFCLFLHVTSVVKPYVSCASECNSEARGRDGRGEPRQMGLYVTGSSDCRTSRDTLTQLPPPWGGVGGGVNKSRATPVPLQAASAGNPTSFLQLKVPRMWRKIAIVNSPIRRDSGESKNRDVHKIFLTSRRN